MPYIDLKSREQYEELISRAKFALEDKPEGDINYVFSSILWYLFFRNKRYSTVNKLIGVLECIKLEFYRRQAAGYEEEKIRENGDII